MPGALEDLTVVALEQAVAAPLCSRKMAEAGARVIKIEPAGGDFARYYDALVDGQSSYFTWLNVGKESIAMDLRADPDRQLLLRILARADIFVQNLRPGSMRALGLDHLSLQRLNPRLVTCDIVGFGRPAEHFARKAYDLLIQAESGLASVTGVAGAASRVGISIVDIATGITAYGAVLEALLKRTGSGRGEHLQISMFDCMAEWMTVPLLYTTYTGAEPAKLGLQHPTIAPYGAFTSADGRSLLIAVQQDREWQSFCRTVLGRSDLAYDPEFATNTARVANRSTVDAVVAACIGALSSAAAVQALQRADIAYAEVCNVADLMRHPALRTFGVQTPRGVVHLPRPADRGDPAPAARLTVPGLDEHGVGIRAEFAAPTGR